MCARINRHNEMTGVHAGDSSVIQVIGLVKKYKGFLAVNGVSFEVFRGEIFGLLGPNGAGKTTTMEMIEGLRRPDQGTATVAGFDTQKELRKVKEVIGVQLQSTSLFELLKVSEIIRMYASFYPHSLSIDPLLEQMILYDKRDEWVKNLSGGQKQRLAIALALVHDPLVVFLDEPTTGLDPQARRTLWDIILRLREQGKTIILSTHYMEEAEVLCDRICLMDRGEIIALDKPDNLVRNLQSESTVQFRLPHLLLLHPEQDQKQILQRLQQINGVKRAIARDDMYILYTDNLQQTLTYLVTIAGEIPFTDLQTRTATLEDVFIHLTGRSLREE